MSTIDEARRKMLNLLIVKTKNINTCIVEDFENMDSEKLIYYSKQLVEISELFKGVSKSFSLFEDLES